MKNAEKEFYKQFAGSLIRAGLTALGGYLATRGYISTAQADGLTQTAAVEFVLSFVLIAGSSLWSWAKTNFNILAIREARKAKVNTPIAEITEAALEKKSLISSV